MKIVITKQRKEDGEEVDDNEKDEVILVSWFDGPFLLSRNKKNKLETAQWIEAKKMKFLK